MTALRISGYHGHFHRREWSPVVIIYCMSRFSARNAVYLKEKGSAAAQPAQ